MAIPCCKSGAIGHLPLKELSPTTKVNLQHRLYCLTCVSGSATEISLDIYLGRKQHSATSFMSLITLLWWTGISSSAVSPDICPYTLKRDVEGIQFIRHFKVTLGQIQSTWSFHSRWSQISHSSSISMGFNYLLQSPCSVLLLHYLDSNSVLWYTHTHVPSCLHILNFNMPQNGVLLS